MLALTAVSCGHHPSVSQEEIACVRDFIRTSWDASVQYIYFLDFGRLCFIVEVY